MNDWMIVPTGTVPIGLQVSEQIRWAIATGGLKPGDPLPSVRELSETLGVARQTINDVYNELRDAGLILMGRGRSTEVAGGDATRNVARLTGLLGLLDEAFARAQQEGFDAKTIARTTMVRAQLLEMQACGNGEPVTLVVDPANEVDWLVRQVAALTGAPVRVVLLPQFQADPARAGSRLVTTCLESRRVRELLAPGTEAVILGVVLPLRDLLKLEAASPNGYVLLVAQTQAAAAWLAEGYSRLGLSITVEPAGLDGENLEERLREAVAVWAPPSVHSALKHEKKALLELSLEASSTEALRLFAERAR